MTQNVQITRRCSFCGSEVRLSWDDLPVDVQFDSLGLTAEGPQPDPPGMDRVVHALCGCYIFKMPESALGRLLASVLATSGDSCDDEEAEGAGPGGGESDGAGPGDERSPRRAGGGRAGFDGEV